MAALNSASSRAALWTVQQSQSPTLPRLGLPMMPATALHTAGHPLAKRHSSWGVIFLGSKEELQCAGFGVGAIFPGEPGGNKKKATFPACNGFAKLEVSLIVGESWLGEPLQSILPNYEISACYIDDERFKREFEPVPDMPEVMLYRNIHSDVYRGRAQALIAASLVDASQLPGQVGTGRMRTTFTQNGVRVKSGSTNQDREGNKTVMAVGKLFEVAVRVSDKEYEIRHSEWTANWKYRDSERERRMAEYLAKNAVPTPVATSRNRSHLKLVWSAL